MLNRLGCAGCHVGGAGTDGNAHDVGSGAVLDTPSLRFVSGTAPYFHDGRFDTLADLLAKTSATMGGLQLNQQQQHAVEAYLTTL